MRNEQTQTEVNWTALGGRILDGGYELEEPLEASDGVAKFKVRVLGDRSIESFATFYQLSINAAVEQVELWNSLKTFPHPNIARPLAAGLAALDGIDLAYVISRKADETLSGALVERALTSAEASEVLQSLATALEYLDEHSLVHGCISPEQILSFGEAIQLSVAPISKMADEPCPEIAPKYRAPESVTGNRTPESDVWCLGATLVEALTQNECRQDCLQTARELPVPFAWVAERCLEENPMKRAKAAEIPKLLAEGEKAVSRSALTSAGLQGGAVLSPPQIASIADESSTIETKEKPVRATSVPVTPPPVSETPPTIKEPVAPSVLAAEPVRPTPASRVIQASRSSIETPLRDEPSRIDQRRRIEESRSPRLSLYAVGGALVLLLVIWWAWPRHAKPVSEAVTAAPTAAAQTQTITPDGIASKNGRSPTGPPSSHGEVPAPSKSVRTSVAQTRALNRVPTPTPQNEVPTVNGSAWRVIVFTFSRSEDAEKKAITINARHPQLKASTFAPSETGGPYLVTVGGTMSREAAVHLRQRAMSEGLPRDSYIQNYRK